MESGGKRPTFLHQPCRLSEQSSRTARVRGGVAGQGTRQCGFSGDPAHLTEGLYLGPRCLLPRARPPSDEKEHRAVMAEGPESEPSLHHGACFPSSPSHHGARDLLGAAQWPSRSVHRSPVAQQERPPLGSAPAANTKHHGPGACRALLTSTTRSRAAQLGSCSWCGLPLWAPRHCVPRVAVRGRGRLPLASFLTA